MIKYFSKFVTLDSVTDVNYNGHDLWIDDLNVGRYRVQEPLDHDAIYQEAIKLSNQLDVSFNPQNPLIEQEESGFRYSLIHPSVSGHLSISIRMIPPIIRIEQASAIASGYAPKHVFDYLIGAILRRKNVMVSGLPGAGKTELIKFLGSHIKREERIITIEDNQELHYKTILPHHDIVSIVVSEWFTYKMAIIASLRQRPDWLMISEVRGDEATELLKAGTIGTYFLSTIHAKNAAAIPLRLSHISGFSVDKIIDILDVGVHVARGPGGRYIETVCEYHPDGPKIIFDALKEAL